MQHKRLSEEDNNVLVLFGYLTRLEEAEYGTSGSCDSIMLIRCLLGRWLSLLNCGMSEDH